MGAGSTQALRFVAYATEENRMSDELWRRSARELAAMIRQGDVSSREVVEAHLTRIDAVNDRVNAVTVILAEEARAAADRADAAGPGAKGPLHGVPITVKENVDLVGSATTRGVEALANEMPTIDAPVTARMKAAGAIPIGRTNLPEMGLRIDTANPLRGRTFNPWAHHLTAGGSSGGEGVALATGMSPLGLGNDIGGSVRNPAYCNGVTSLKPTRGRLPRVYTTVPENLDLSSQIMSSEGPMARTVDDVQLALEILNGRHPGDPTSVDVALVGAAAPLTAALVTAADGVDIDPICADATRRAADALTAAGWEVTEVAPPELALVTELWGSMMAADISASLPLLEQFLSPELVALLDQTPEFFSDMPTATCHVERHRLGREWSNFFADHSVMITPTWTKRPFEHDRDLQPGGIEMMVGLLPFITPGNVLGIPAAAVPTGLVDGLPTGVQVYADLWRDDLALEAAQVVEDACGTITPIDPL